MHSFSGMVVCFLIEEILGFIGKDLLEVSFLQQLVDLNP